MNTDYSIAHELFDELWSSLGGNKVWLDRVRFMAMVPFPQRLP